MLLVRLEQIICQKGHPPRVQGGAAREGHAMDTVIGRTMMILWAVFGMAALVLSIVFALNGDWVPLVVFLPGLAAYSWTLYRILM